MADIIKKMVAKDYTNVFCVPHKKVLSLRKKGCLLYGIRSDTLCLTETEKGINKEVRYFFAEAKQKKGNLVCLLQVAPNEQNIPELHVIAYKRKTNI